MSLGPPGLRIAVSNHLMTTADVDASVEAELHVARNLRAGSR